MHRIAHLESFVPLAIVQANLGFLVIQKRMTEQGNVDPREAESEVEETGSEEAGPEAGDPRISRTPIWKRFRSGNRHPFWSTAGQGQASFKAASNASGRIGHSARLCTTVNDLMEEARAYKPPTLQDQSQNAFLGNSADADG